VIGGLDSGVKGNAVEGARARNCGNGGEYGVVRIHISPSGTVLFILLHSHDVQHLPSV